MEGKTNSRENNFNIIRFMAAIMVMAGHMPRNTEPWS